MYKPPENLNRVKAIKDKFEDDRKQCKIAISRGVKDRNITVSGTFVKENLSKTELSQHPLFNLSRQLSDPGKKNVKRTPAFRLDNQPIDEKDARLIKNRSRYLYNKKSSLIEGKPKPNDSCNNNNEQSTGNGNDSFQSITLTCEGRNSCNNKQVVDKCPTDDELNFPPSSSDKTKGYIGINESKIENKNLSMLKALYAEPIPKHLRSNKCEVKFLTHNNIIDANILENNLLTISANSLPNEEHNKNNKNKNVEHASINNDNDSDKESARIIDDTLTDTLKTALKRPLPSGPAPRKPPRTFIHFPNKDCDLQNNLEGNSIFLSRYKTFNKRLNLDLQKQNSYSSSSSRQQNHNDPVYMLEKLEKALKNNICLKRQIKNQRKITESNFDNSHNSHYNSVDLGAIRLKNNDDNDNLKTNPLTSPICKPKLNFNCLKSLGCTSVEYKTTKESSFVSYDKEEPLYAEPFEFRRCTSDGKIKNLRKGEQQKKMLQTKSLVNVRDDCLHYASCPIPDETPSKSNSKQVFMKLNQLDLGTNEMGNATPVSSSPCTSDIESTISSLSEENGTSCQTKKVKDIISVFESSPDHVPKGAWSSHSSSRNKREEGVAQITKKFEIYVKRVRSKVYTKSSNKKDTFKHLFDCFLLVGLNGNTPYIKSKYPENVEIPHKIEELCFPDAQSESMDLSEAAQCYSLVITNASGQRTYGYCRRVLPEGSSTCLPLVYCIVSHHCAPGFYKKILQELESRHGFSEKFKGSLLNELYNSRFPKAGETIKVSIQKTVSSCNDNKEKKNEDADADADVNHPIDLSFCTAVDRLGEYAKITKIIGDYEKQTSNNLKLDGYTKIQSIDDLENNGGGGGGQAEKSCSSSNLIFDESTDCSPLELVLYRHSDTRHEENNLQTLCNSLPISTLHQVFSSLLLERKVVIVSKILSKISACVEALQIALYPFVWPHTLIPVLPQCLWEILEAPTPLLCGVLSKQVINLYKIENGMVVDLDDGSILLKVGDEDKILRWTLFDTWKDGLSLAKSVPSHQSAHNVLLSDAFLRVFIKSCGHYKQHIVNGEFQKTSFIESGKIKGRGIRSFLTWFSETTMFYTFIETALKNQNTFHIFDQRIEIYSSEATGDILKKMKENSKEKNSFFKFT